ncbi:MAG: aminoglycoside phosphotransferase family protein [Pyrinomonadaceae bacterium]
MNKNFIAKLPEKFRRNTLDLCGKLGEQWLNDLPRIIEEIESRWRLNAEKPFQNLSYNYVAPCVCADCGEAVLKIAPPLNNPEIFNEERFLQMANGNGAVKLLKSDKSLRAILLEKLTPGENLKEVCRRDDAKAVEVFITIMDKLLKDSPPNLAFRSLDEWFNNFFEEAANTKFPFEFQNKTRKFYEQLSNVSKQKFLLHGDLHHENILSAGREAFLAIDPKGIIGEVGYETAVFLNNHHWWLASEPNLEEKLNDAVRRFSEAFAIKPLDLRKWAYSQMVLSAWWTFDENGKNWEKDLAFAEFWEV